MTTEEPATIYFTGTAGAGKTSLLHAFSRWLEEEGCSAVTVNLDPGAEHFPTEPDVDIREWVRLSDVMADHDLGPNGAQIVAADLTALKIFEVKKAVDEMRADLVLVDTPGQVELFAFRESSRTLVEALSGERSSLVFLFDPLLSRNASGFSSLLMLSATVEFRFRLPLITALSKVDTLLPEKVEEILSWSEVPERLQDALHAETDSPESLISIELLRSLEAVATLTPLLPTSSQEGKGMNLLYRAIQNATGGSEDIERPQEPIER